MNGYTYANLEKIAIAIKEKRNSNSDTYQKLSEEFDELKVNYYGGHSKKEDKMIYGTENKFKDLQEALSEQIKSSNHSLQISELYDEIKKNKTHSNFCLEDFRLKLSIVEGKMKAMELQNDRENIYLKYYEACIKGTKDEILKYKKELFFKIKEELKTDFRYKLQVERGDKITDDRFREYLETVGVNTKNNDSPTVGGRLLHTEEYVDANIERIEKIKEDNDYYDNVLLKGPTNFNSITPGEFLNSSPLNLINKMYDLDKEKDKNNTHSRIA